MHIEPVAAFRSEREKRKRVREKTRTPRPVLTKVLEIRMEAEMFDALRRISAETDRTIPYLIRLACARFIQDYSESKN